MALQRLEADQFWARRCLGFHIQASPDRETVRALLALQRHLSEASPLALHLIPAEALHLSVFTLVSAQAHKRSKEELWKTIRGAMSAEVEALAYRKGAIQVAFERMAFTSKAVIVTTSDQPEPFRTLRNRLSALLRSLDLPVPEYDQTHVTIARFAESRDVDLDVLSSIERSFLSFTGVFDGVRPVRERQYPSLVINDL